MVDQNGLKAEADNTEQPTVEVWAERGEEQGSEDGAVTVFLTDDHLVARVNDTCHLFALPDLADAGQQPGDYNPDTTAEIGQFRVNPDEVLEGDGFVLSFADNTEADERLMHISGPSDDYAFNCEGLQFEYGYCTGRGSEHLHD